MESTVISHNLAGNKFGKLTPVAEVGRNQRGLILWECQCDCGNTHVVAEPYLLSGKSKSCGCLSRGRKKKDLTGNTFGLLTAIKIVGMSKRGSALWECKCICGNRTIVSQEALGNTISCGCSRKIKGKRFWNLTAIRMVSVQPGKYGKRPIRSNPRKWECLCDCGKTIILKQTTLTHGRRKSCGCCSSQYKNETQKILKKERALKRQRQDSKNLSDSYIKKLLTKKSSLCAADIPPELVEFQRERIKLIRENRNGKNWILIASEQS